MVRQRTEVRRQTIEVRRLMSDDRDQKITLGVGESESAGLRFQNKNNCRVEKWERYKDLRIFRHGKR